MQRYITSLGKIALEEHTVEPLLTATSQEQSLYTAVSSLGPD